MPRKKILELHPNSDAWTSKFKACLRFAGDWSGTAYRFVTVRYANCRDLLSGVGSRRLGGRWNPPDLFNVVYGCLTPQGAITESLGIMNRGAVPPVNLRPRVFAAVTLRLQKVLDLSPAPVQEALEIDLDRVLQERWRVTQDSGCEAASQAMGRIAWELRLEGIIVPSAVESVRNIVAFPGRRLKGSSWRIQGARDLPPRQS